MRYDQLFTKLFCRPICLEAGVRAGFERVLLAYMAGQPVGIFDEHTAATDTVPRFFGRKIAPARADARADGILEVDGSTAIIHIDGAIDRNLSAMDRLCFDACDLVDVQRALARVSNDSAIKNVMLAIDSPGGTVQGVPETAAMISDLAKKKNVFACTEGSMCSAAYWLASGADQIFCTASSYVGSIGVYMAILDESRALEDQGLKVQMVKSGSLKAAGASFKPLSDDERAYFQNLCDEIAQMFKGAATDKRPGIEDGTMQGQAFLGASAVAAGLADAQVASLADALAQF